MVSSRCQHLILMFYCLYTLLPIIIGQTVYDHEYIPDLDGLLDDSKQNHDMAIYGNPLLLKKCRNALLDEHKYNIDDILQYKGFPSPWFWSRESLDATLRDKALHRRLKITHALPFPEFILPWSSTIGNQYNSKYKGVPYHKTRWYDRLGDITDIGNTYNDDYESPEIKLSNMMTNEVANDNIFYYHIEKSGSSSIGSGILTYYNYNNSYISENMISHTGCGFSFVREPISRFISAYYTVNRLIYFHNIAGTFKVRYKHDVLFKWWNKTGEPQRITQFVDDLIENDYNFVVESPLEHIMTQSGILSVSQNDIHFIGRLKKLKAHWGKLYDFCDNDLLKPYPEKEYSRMKGYGIKGIKEKKNYPYFKMMGLDKYEDGDLLPAFKAVADSYDLYHKIATYYKQDFICFGFEPDFKGFRKNIYEKWNKMKKKRILKGFKGFQKEDSSD